MNTGTTVLNVSNLAVEYRQRGLRAKVNRVIEDVSFSIAEGETLALVGESGSGKSTIGKAVLGLTPAVEGSIKFRGQELRGMKTSERRALSSEIQAIFQNPYGSLNPALSIGRILAEPLLAAGRPGTEVRSEIEELLRIVNMPVDTMSRYPGDFSGGQRQRIAIARAVSMRPALIVCDEPTSALDVSTQASVLELLTTLQEQTGVAYLFITHDLAVVREFASRTIVLEKGHIVESGESSQICERPKHPYTQRLVASAPVPDPRLQRERRLLRREVLERNSAV